MKKKWLVLTGALMLCMAFGGCGKKEETPAEPETVQVEEVPEEEPVVDNRKLVNMEKTDPSEREKNVIGKKSASAAKMTIINRTGDEVDEIYIRTNIDDDEEWGEELMQTKFTLKDGEQATYYFEKGGSDEIYDIRIGYLADGKNECFFRKLPMNAISQIILCMDDEYDIPYARYLTGAGSSEISTLDEVKHRLGLDDDYDDEDDEDEEEYKEPEYEEPEQYEEEEEEEYDPTPTPKPEREPIDLGPINEEITAAENCIGRPLSALIDACGEPNGTNYENEPETGETGYHYYNGFTVSTTVDENGNEIVAGVW